MIGIADTGFLVAYLNRRDHYHAWARELALTVEAPLPTAEAVLAETAFHIQSVDLVCECVRTGLVEIVFDLAKNIGRIQRLAKSYRDRRPHLADLCLICLSEDLPELPVLTVDGDFRIYRRHKRNRIPVIMPPGV